MFTERHWKETEIQATVRLTAVQNVNRTREELEAAVRRGWKGSLEDVWMCQQAGSGTRCGLQGALCDVNQPHKHLEQLSGAGNPLSTQKGATAEQRLLCQTGAEQGDFVWFANRHEERVYPGITALICSRAKFKLSSNTFWILNTSTWILCCFSANNDIRIIYKVTGWTMQNPAENIN